MDAEIQKHYDKVRELGCLACWKDWLLGGTFQNSHLQLHHPWGKKNKINRMKVIPLCYNHHQSDSNCEPASVHGNKKRFRELYGSELELYTHVQEVIYGDKE